MQLSVYLISALLLKACVPRIDAYKRSRFRCPVAAEFDLLAKNTCSTKNEYYCLLCPTTEKYKCLFDTLAGKFIEGCDGPSKVRKGFKKILAGSFTNEPCDTDRYQPITFYTNESSSCIYEKSLCNEEGQTIFNNGSDKADRLCSCDYMKGFAFVNASVNAGFCSPSDHKDCSCYIKQCNLSQSLAEDYRCISGTGKQQVGAEDTKYIEKRSQNDKPTFNDELLNTIGEIRQQLKIVTTCILLLFLVVSLLFALALVYDNQVSERWSTLKCVQNRKSSTTYIFRRLNVYETDDLNGQRNDEEKTSTVAEKQISEEYTTSNFVLPENVDERDYLNDHSENSFIEVETQIHEESSTTEILQPLNVDETDDLNGQRSDVEKTSIAAEKRIPEVAADDQTFFTIHNEEKPLDTDSESSTTEILQPLNVDETYANNGQRSDVEIAAEKRIPEGISTYNKHSRSIDTTEASVSGLQQIAADDHSFSIKRYEENSLDTDSADSTDEETETVKIGLIQANTTDNNIPLLDTTENSISELQSGERESLKGRRFLNIICILYRIATPLVRKQFNKEIKPGQLKKTIDTLLGNLYKMVREKKISDKIFTDATSDIYDLNSMVQVLNILPGKKPPIVAELLILQKHFLSMTEEFENSILRVCFETTWDDIAKAILRVAATELQQIDKTMKDSIWRLHPMQLDYQGLYQLKQLLDTCSVQVLSQIVVEYIGETRFSDFLDEQKHELFHKRQSTRSCCECKIYMNSTFTKAIPEVLWKRLFEETKTEDNEKHKKCNSRKCMLFFRPRWSDTIKKDSQLLCVLILHISKLLKYVVRSLYTDLADHLECSDCKHIAYTKTVSHRMKMFSDSDIDVLYEKCGTDFKGRKDINLDSIDPNLLSKLFVFTGPLSTIYLGKDNFFQDSIKGLGNSKNVSYLCQNIKDAIKVLIPVIKDQDCKEKILETIRNLEGSNIDRLCNIEEMIERWIKDNFDNVKESEKGNLIQVLRKRKDDIYELAWHNSTDFSLLGDRKWLHTSNEENNFLKVFYLIFHVAYIVVKEMYDEFEKELQTRPKRYTSESGEDEFNMARLFREGLKTSKKQFLTDTDMNKLCFGPIKSSDLSLKQLITVLIVLKSHKDTIKKNESPKAKTIGQNRSCHNTAADLTTGRILQAETGTDLNEKANTRTIGIDGCGAVDVVYLNNNTISNPNPDEQSVVSEAIAVDRSASAKVTQDYKNTAASLTKQKKQKGSEIKSLRILECYRLEVSQSETGQYSGHEFETKFDSITQALQNLDSKGILQEYEWLKKDENILSSCN